MSPTGVDLYRRSLAAFNRAAETFDQADIDAFVEFYDSEAEFHTITAAYVDGSGFRGHAGIREYFDRIAEVAERIHVDADDVRDLGDRVLTIGRWQLRGRGSGIEVESRAGWVTIVGVGKITASYSFNEPSEALAAVGLAS